ncbi:magnesium chelatase subunit D family protein [Streptomyces barkulensis]|uniref:magnesium chelatase subunit D family protein n=1 Tax=Streptomyces barkulensis TaxID=1257026 RepID=UPI0014034E95|nr:magnesium chelatase subunit D family protein [Streptomyces barkulensis]
MDDLRLALLLNAVSPAVGGVLVRGEKGTAKSTAVRALAALMPPVEAVPGCRFSCDPRRLDPSCPDGPHEAGPGESRPARMVELPVGASEDRLVGSLDIERALAEGVKAFEPGLLAQAHRGVLYVDEVNLLQDFLIDSLLDAAAMGVVHIEREGVSVRHSSRFLLVGTMNPEEGELRPQLLDRFGLTVEVAASRETGERMEVVRRRLAYEEDPAAFAARWAGEESGLRERIAAARALLPKVRLGDTALRQIAATCAAFEVDGMRADIVMARTATALAAWAGRTDVAAEDVRRAALLALPHRRRRNPFDAPGLDEDKLDETLRRTTGARRPRGALSRLHLAATVRAAAPHQRARGRSGPGLLVRREDLREAVREGRESNLVLFVVDASGSMAARRRMGAVKGAVLSLLLDAYQRRDKVGLVSFRGSGAEVALPPTSSVDAAAARLESLPTGGRTPLAAGLLKARDVLRTERLRDPSRRPLLVAVTDGRATGGPQPVPRARQAARLLAADGTASVVIDCESGPVRLELAGALAAELGGPAVTLEELRADTVTGLVRSLQAPGRTHRTDRENTGRNTARNPDRNPDRRAA